MRKIFALVAFVFAFTTLAGAPAVTAQPPMAMPNIEKGGPPAGKLPLYALARQAGLSTLADAIEIAGLQRTLLVEGPFTVFAPTNDAFAALGDETLEAVLSDVELLTDILLYHVAPGELLAADVLASSTITMANGDEVQIDAADVQVNDSNIIATDILARNGVVHLIDAVLLPPTSDATIELQKSSESQSWSEVKSQF